MAPPLLPEELQLEIVTRADSAATVLRCAATCKPLRRGILDPAFRRRLARRAAANGGGFDPALLVAISYRPNGKIHTSPRGCRLRFDRGLLLPLWFHLACSRDGLIVLWRDAAGGRLDLRVCSSFTGQATSLPPVGLGTFGKDAPISDLHRPALLTVGHSKFKLLVMDTQLRIRTFSSQDGEWGHVRQVQLPPGVRQAATRWGEVLPVSPAVTRRAVHWLSHLERDLHHGMFILSLQCDDDDNSTVQEATVNELPQGVAGLGCRVNHGLILVATEEGTRPSIVVAEALAISMWTLSPDGWSRQLLVRRREIDTKLISGPAAYQAIRFYGFGARSGCIFFRLQATGLIQLNLGTNKVMVLPYCRDLQTDDANNIIDLVCLHEVDLVSLLRGMKHY